MQGQMQVLREGGRLAVGVGLEKGVWGTHGSFAIGGHGACGDNIGEGTPWPWMIRREQGQMNSWSNLELRPVARRRWEVASTWIAAQTRRGATFSGHLAHLPHIDAGPTLALQGTVPSHVPCGAKRGSIEGPGSGFENREGAPAGLPV